jgi:hypothetical protein
MALSAVAREDVPTVWGGGIECIDGIGAEEGESISILPSKRGNPKFSHWKPGRWPGVGASFGGETEMLMGSIDDSGIDTCIRFGNEFGSSAGFGKAEGGIS